MLGNVTFVICCMSYVTFVQQIWFFNSIQPNVKIPVSVAYLSGKLYILVANLFISSKNFCSQDFYLQQRITNMRYSQTLIRQLTIFSSRLLTLIMMQIISTYKYVGISKQQSDCPGTPYPLCCKDWEVHQISFHYAEDLLNVLSISFMS